RVPLIFGFDFARLHLIRYGYRSAKIIGVRCSEARDIFSRLSPRGGITGVCVDDAIYAFESAIQRKMRRKVRRWPQIAFANLAVEICNHKIPRSHRVVRNSARFYHDFSRRTVKAASIPEGEHHQSAAD